jgi:hypothetical protein
MKRLKCAGDTENGEEPIFLGCFLQAKNTENCSKKYRGLQARFLLLGI